MIAGAREASSHTRRIIFVDDEDSLVILLTIVLKRRGYEVSGFTDPLQALNTLRERPSGFDALVTDLSMPVMSGIVLAQEALQVRPDLPIVLTSGHVSPHDRELALRTGISEVILKPDTVEGLGDTLHRLLEKGRSGGNHRKL